MELSVVNMTIGLNLIILFRYSLSKKIRKLEYIFLERHVQPGLIFTVRLGAKLTKIINKLECLSMAIFSNHCDTDPGLLKRFNK